MKNIEFGQWAQVLAQTNLSERQKASWTITLKWYLGFCRRSRAGVTVQSAREFIEWAQGEKQPEPWQVEGWKEALNWFFRAANAPVAGPKPGSSAAQGGQETSNSDKSRAGIPHRTFNIQQSSLRFASARHSTSNAGCSEAPLPGPLPIAAQRGEGERERTVNYQPSTINIPHRTSNNQHPTSDIQCDLADA